MRHDDRNILQQDPRVNGMQCALWLVADGLRWASEALENASSRLFRKAGNVESLWDPCEKPERVLLSSTCQRLDDVMQEIKIQCPGCFQKVVAVLEVEGIERCADCRAIAADRKNQFQNSGLN